ncbi:MAG TPA: TonB-dependent receptor, partial [Gemmatimonadales bacterium]
MPEKLAVLGALAVGALLASPPPLAAQNTGGIEGQVRDDAGRPLSAAEVIVRAPGEAIAGRAATDGNGAWRITFLAPGRYQLLIRRLGYRPATREIAIEPGIVARLTVVLEPVPLMLDSLVASAPAVSVSTTDNELGSRLTRREIALLPTTLDARPLISLTPGARPNQIWGGASDQANSYVLDGTLVNHPGVGGVFFTPSVSWIDRLEVKGLGAGAEYGNFQGGLVNVVTRSGGNTLEGEVRSAVESRQFNGSNLIPGEIGRELSNRWEVDAQVRGPLVRDRLHFALFGHFVHEDERVLNQLPGVADRFAPDAPGLDDRRGLAKLSWRLGERDLVQATFWGRSRDGERTGQTGFEAPEATERLRHWIGAGNLTWQRNWSPRNALEVRLGGFASRERREPYGGSDLPGVETLILVDPAGYQNAPFRTRAEPTSLSADATWTLRGRAGGLEHELKLGAEYVAGSWEFEQLRNGGMTWRPYPREEFDPPTPATWFTGALLNSSWGGEVRLDSDVRNGAVFVQDYIRLSPWVQLNPGFRLGWWSGHLTPTGGQRFTAVRDEAVDPRIGVVVDLSGRGTFAAKVHWGRYHQSMFAAFFDRVEGGQVYNNEEIWAYRGPAFADPGT